MNARLTVAVHPLPFELGQVPPWSPESERAILGAAMLGEPMPPWLEPRHFFAAQYQRIYQAVLDVGANPARVYAWLRESSPPTGPLVVKSTELAAMVEEGAFARDYGWGFEFELVRELWRRRELMTLLARLQIRLRAGDVGHEEARLELRAHFKEVR